MSDDLDHLRNMPPPPPRLAARKRALAAGLAAFRQAKAPATINSEPAKGIPAPPRLTLASSSNAGSKVMRARTYYALAASVAVVALGAPMAFELWKSAQLHSSFGDVSASLNLPEPLRQAKQTDAERIAAAPQATAPMPAPAQTPPQPRLEGDLKIALAPPSPPPAPEPAPAAPLPASLPAPAFAAADVPPAPAPMPEAAKSKKAELAPDKGRADGAARTRATVAGTDVLAAQSNQPALPAPAPAVAMAEAGDLADTATSAKGGTPAESMPQQAEDSRDKHPAAAPSPVHHVAEEPVSTFSIDVDTAAYSFARRAINAGQLPQRAAVRVEEMINYFPYDYPRPETAAVPFRPTVTVAPSPWAEGHKLVHIAIKGYDIQRAERPRANIVLLVDVSGSMQPADRLPLLKNAWRLLVDELQPQDTVSIVTYASGVATALAPTKVAQKQKIIAAIDRLGSGGGTAGAEGLQRAYQLAQENFDARGVNRIILGTDGDFNLGISDVGQLKSFIEQKRASGIFLSVLGVGHGNYNDELMQALAQNGNGTAAYIDTLGEARKVLAEEVGSTLFPIAKDVKIQIEFNPAAVSDYRLIGYETRALKREDFNNDKVDAGDIGSGHTVTAIYEITPRGAPGLVDDLRYGAARVPAVDGTLRVAPGAGENEYGFLKLRYKLPDEDTSRLLTVPVTRELEVKRIEDAPREVRFSVAVAAFGQLLQGAPYLKDFGYEQVLALAGAARGEDTFGYRAEFMNLVRLAKSAR